MALRLLIVDDEPQFERLIRQRLSRKFKQSEYELLFATDGFEALDKLSSRPDIEIILSDINMPRMDGLVLLEKTRELYPKTKTIIVSAYGDMSNIRRAMNLGAFDFVTKPIDFNDLTTTIEKTREAIQLTHKFAEVEKKNQHLLEIDRLKTQFFTNISHEFRTPLTIISGMADQIKDHPETWLEQGVGMIQRNSQRMLTMVDQILELRKIQTQNVQINRQQVDILGYLDIVVEAHTRLSEMKDIVLSFYRPDSPILMDVDIEKFETIVTNLLANAIKYTKEGGEVSFKVERLDHNLVLNLSDTGIGIPEDQIDEIFNRFFQVESNLADTSLGTGIGLSLVKELTKMMDGQIRVSSTVGKGTTFTVSLPITNHAHFSKDLTLTPHQVHPIESVGAISVVEDALDPNDGLNKVLLIDDSPDVLLFLQSCLQGLYQVHVAHNGQLGIETSFEIIPDVIISDVMMPGVGGLELCSTLKGDRRTSHIPIILLTAKADQQSKFEGLNRGADAYITKPFHKKELLIRLDKLIELRQVLRKKYQDLDEIHDNADQEDQFITELKRIIHTNMQEDQFGILQLCKSIGMSRTQLHRKIKALTGISTSIFVRQVRLIEAKKLLLNSQMNISEIAYEVGFNDPKYFSTSFVKEFGKPPKQFRLDS